MPTSSTPQTLDLAETYVQLRDNGDAVPLEVGDDFWDIVEERYSAGRLVSAYDTTTGFGPEMHPEGDELVVLISGSLDLILEEGTGERVITLRPGSSCVVPRGVWHRSIAHEASRVLHITAGKGTQHRR